MSLCQWAQCTHAARFGLYLSFAAKGAPPDSERAITTALVVVCAAHAEPARASEWFGPLQRKSLTDVMRHAGYAEPDFDTARVLLRPLREGNNLD